MIKQKRELHYKILLNIFEAVLPKSYQNLPSFSVTTYFHDCAKFAIQIQ